MTLSQQRYEEGTMTKIARLWALAAVLTLGLSMPVVAAIEGEFDGECVMGLALGKEIKTDCSVNTVYGGKTYCFGNETAQANSSSRSPRSFCSRRRSSIPASSNKDVIPAKAGIQ